MNRYNPVVFMRFGSFGLKQFEARLNACISMWIQHVTAFYDWKKDVMWKILNWNALLQILVWFLFSKFISNPQRDIENIPGKQKPTMNRFSHHQKIHCKLCLTNSLKKQIQYFSTDRKWREFYFKIVFPVFFPIAPGKINLKFSKNFPYQFVAYLNMKSDGKTFICIFRDDFFKC